MKIEDETLKWFDEHFPMYGAKQWFVAECFEALKRLHGEGKVEAPIDLMDTVVKEGASEV